MADGINSFDPNLTNEGCPTWVSLPVGMDYKPMPFFRITVKANGSETIYEAPTLEECVSLKVRSEPPTVLTFTDRCDMEAYTSSVKRWFPDRQFLILPEDSLGRYIPPHPPSPIQPESIDRHSAPRCEKMDGSSLRIVPSYTEAGMFQEANCLTVTDGERTAVYVLHHTVPTKAEWFGDGKEYAVTTASDQPTIVGQSS